MDFFIKILYNTFIKTPIQLYGLIVLILVQIPLISHLYAAGPDLFA